MARMMHQRVAARHAWAGQVGGSILRASGPTQPPRRSEPVRHASLASPPEAATARAGCARWSPGAWLRSRPTTRL